MKGAVDVGEGGRELGGLQLCPGDAVLVEAGGVLEARVFPRRAAVGAGEALGVEDANGLFQFVAHHADGGDQIGIAGDDDGAIVVVAKTVEQEVGGEVYVGTFFLGLEHLQKFGGGFTTAAMTSRVRKSPSTISMSGRVRSARQKIIWRMGWPGLLGSALTLAVKYLVPTIQFLGKARWTKATGLSQRRGVPLRAL